MNSEKTLHRVLNIVEDEIKPRANYRDARSVFAEIFPEAVPPVLRDYRHYLLICAELKREPLSQSEWEANAAFATGRSS